MPELFDTGSVRDDAEYWDGRAARVAERALAEGSRGFVDAWSRSRATWAAAGLLFAAGLALMALSSRASAPDATSWRVMLAPADDVGQLLATRAGPPSIGALLEPKSETGRP